jgi:hypothetical protein
MATVIERPSGIVTLCLAGGRRGAPDRLGRPLRWRYGQVSLQIDFTSPTQMLSHCVEQQ